MRTLLKMEVEHVIEKKYGANYLKQKSKKELSEINRELKTLNSRISELEKRKQELLGS